MTVTKWSDGRLQKLFDRYNRVYWRAALPQWPVEMGELDEACGRIVPTERKLLIDITRHTSDAGVRATVLHEMAHLAAKVLGKARIGHNSAFFAQVEHLLKRGAPITVGFPENQGRVRLESVPRKFRRVREAMRVHYERRTRHVEERIKAGTPVVQLDLPSEFHEVGLQDVPWETALGLMDNEYGLLDADGRPLAWFARLLPKARAAHRRGLEWVRANRAAARAFGET